MVVPASEESGIEPPAAPAPGLRAVLGPFDATMIVMGSVIGAGVFRTPAKIAELLGAPWAILGLWVLGGVIALCGALVFAELGSALPQAGGQYVFVRAAFGRFAAFLLGWVLLTAINSSAIAYVASVFSDHLLRLLQMAWPQSRPPPQSARALAIALIVSLTWLNARGVRLGALVQDAAMLAKIAGMLLLIVLGALVALGWAQRGGPPAAPLAATGQTWSWSAAGAALLQVVFAYGGFQNVAAIAGEIREPARNLPRAILLGTVGVVILYLLLNASLLEILGAQGIARSNTPVASAAGAVLSVGEGLVAGLVVVSTFAACQVMLMVLPRIYYAMALDGVFLQSAARVHPRHRTPHVAIAALGAVAVLYVLAGRHADELLEICELCDWVFFCLCGLALFVLRRKRPDLPRPYRALGYPVLPGVFVLFSAGIVVNAILTARARPVLLGLSLFGAGAIFYAVWKRRSRLYQA